MRGARGAVVSTLVAGLLWGSSFAIVKVGLRSIDPFWFVFLRFGLASAIALAVSAISGRSREVVSFLRSPLVIWLGVSNAAGFLCQFKGQTMTTASHAALLINASTIFVAIASRFVFRERFGAIKVAAIAIGMAGVFMVTTGGSLRLPGGPGFVGDLMVLCAAFLWTFFFILDKKIVSGRDVDIVALTTAMVIVTAAAAAPVALIFGKGGFPVPSPEWWTIPYTAVLCTVVPFFLWTSGLRFISVTMSSVIILVEVVFALALAAVILGERLSAGAWVGSFMILGAVALAARETSDAAPVGPDVVPEEPCCTARTGGRPE